MSLKKGWLVALLLLAPVIINAESSTSSSQLTIRDVATLEGVRDNPLIGYGMVVGLNGTGDRRQTIFTIQALANILQRMGLQIPPAAARVNNVAAVFVTASLPAFARPGTKLDVTVSSMGDAKSLEGGLLLLTPLYGADGQVYGAAQGALTLGGYTAGLQGNSKQVNHPTVARVPEGGTVERDAGLDVSKLGHLSLMLRDADFGAAEKVAEAVNGAFGRNTAVAVDARRVNLDPSLAKQSGVAAVMARIDALPVVIHPRGKVVVNERTGTIVMGKDVRLGAVSILHGNLSIEITTDFQVSQPPALSGGDTVVVPQPSVKVQDATTRHIELAEGANVEQLVMGLQTIGATARDVVAILQALKAAGALQADLEVI